ncbi:MAG TPA: PfkB family carbohydrate kinase [Candidatus Paceibacterota bacterium]|nr:PfkB family carbohydrate kinase [Candidatus Paceibacterota bacterium]
MDNLVEIINTFPQKTVLVVGDVMLDRYTYGSVERISPEAPIPVLRKTSEKYVLGGAGNVAMNIASLGAKVFLCGVVGNDHNSEIVFDILRSKKIDPKGLLVHKKKPTILKHRIVSGNQQMLRVDEEEIGQLDEASEKELVSRVLAALAKSDVVIFSDYAKGVFSKKLAQYILTAAKKHNRKVLADLKPKNKEFFVGVDVISPNLKEGKEITGEESVEKIGKALVDYFGSDVMLTRSGDGISVFEKKGAVHRHIPGKKITVFDVSGAGDTAIAVAALGIASGLELETAAVLANAAGAVVVQKPGTATLSLEELISELKLENHIERVDVVPKVWGYEKWLENNDKYCSKLLSLNKGYQCSLHYHKVKDEMFIVTKGHVRLELGGKVTHLREGGFMRIPPGAQHRFSGMEDSLIIEVSTHHDEADSYRIEESRKIETA